MNNYKSYSELQEELGENYPFKLYEMGISALKEIENLQQELQRKDNIINELKQNKRDYERENILEMKLHILDNNWNELKEWLNKPQITYNLDATEFGIEKIECVSVKDTLNKIKELESK